MGDLIDYKNAVSCFYGRAATGKTTFCLMAAAKEKGKVIFIDTENSFSSERIRQIAGKIPGNIAVIRAKSFDEQCRAVENLLELKGKIAMVIVDSLTAHYRQELQEKKDVNPLFSKQMSILKELAGTVPVIVTSQVYTAQDGNINPIGSGMLKNWCGNVIKLDDDGKNRKLFVEKSKNGNKEACFEIVNEGINFIY